MNYLTCGVNLSFCLRRDFFSVFEGFWVRRLPLKIRQNCSKKPLLRRSGVMTSDWGWGGVFEIIVWLLAWSAQKLPFYIKWQRGKWMGSAPRRKKIYVWSVNEAWWCYRMVSWLITFQFSLQTFWKGKRNAAIYISCCSARNFAT